MFLLWFAYEYGATVELVDDIEDILGEFIGRHFHHEQAADLQMDLGAHFVGDQRIGSFLDAVVDESV